MLKITTKDDFWKWLDDVYVKQFYGNNMAKILSTTNKDVTRFDHLQTSINASYMIVKPCVTRIPAQRGLCLRLVLDAIDASIFIISYQCGGMCTWQRSWPSMGKDIAWEFSKI